MEPFWKSPLTSALVSRRVIKCQIHSELQGSVREASGPPQQGTAWEQEISHASSSFCYFDVDNGVRAPTSTRPCTQHLAALSSVWGCPISLSRTSLSLHTGLGGQGAFH